MTKAMKKTLALILSIMMLMSALPMTYSFAESSGYYTYSRSGSEATITKYSGSEAKVEIPDDFGSYATVVAIGESAFFKNTSMTSLVISDSIKTIGDGAFYECTALKEVVIGKNVETIGSNAFKYCTILATVTIGANVKSIESNAFLNTDITTVYYDGTKEQWETLTDGIDGFGTATVIYTYDCEENGHELGDKTEAKAATCEEDGNIEYWTCIYCQENFSDATAQTKAESVIVPAGHKWTEATCTTAKTCSVCNATEGEALGHKEVVIPAEGATCTKEGSTEGLRCEVCGKITKEAETVEATGHNYVKDDEKSVAPTCTEEGINYTVCENCGDVKTEKVKALGHKKEVIIEKVAPTCTVPGKTQAVVCKACNSVFEASVEIPATGHNYIKDDEKSVVPTCTKEGINYTVCENCGDVKTEKVKALGHKKEISIEAIAPTCTEAGRTKAVVCKVCASVFEVSVEVPALGHTKVIDEAKAPTCEDTGLTEGEHCSVCGEVTVPQVTVEALGHSYDWRETKAPSCTAQGEETGICTVCEDIAVRATDMLPHNKVTNHSVPATCLNEGYFGGVYCTLCEQYLELAKVEPALGHNFEKNTEMSFDATCKKEGRLYKECSREGCDATTDEVLPLADHSYTEWQIKKTATCTAEGLKARACKVCFDVETAAIDALGHTWNDGEVVKAATCVAKGEKKFTCTVEECGAEKTEEIEIDETNHANIVEDAEVAATCYSTGLTAGTHCGDCDEIIIAQTVTEKTAHTWNDGVVVKEATCVAKGEKKFTCTVAECGAEKTEEIAIDETNHANIVEDPAVAATCYATGLTAGTHCGDCDEVIIARTVTEKTAHTWNDGVVVKEATCVAKGEKKFTCTVAECGAEKTEEIAIDETNHANIVEDSAVAATCYATGLTAGTHCGDCDEVIIAQTVTEKTAHTWNDGVVVKEATCVAKGEKKFTCTVAGCGAEKTEEIEIDETNHANIVEDPAVAATCYETGLTAGTHCGDCNTIIIAQTVTEKTAHTWNDGVVVKKATCVDKGEKKFTCTVAKCGAEKTEEIDALGHNIVNHKAEKPTCTKNGYDAYETCTRCDYTTYRIIPANGHTRQVVKGVAATCTETGLSDAVICTVCQVILVDFEETPALGHDHEIDEDISVAPTCEEKGSNTFACSRCDDTYTEEVPALGHDHVIDEAASTKPTCTEKGINKFVCSRCDNTQTEEVDALGHNVTNWITSDTATCTKEGGKVGRCIACYSIVREKIDKLAHEDTNNDKKCDDCGTALETEEPEDPTKPSDPTTPEDPEDKPDTPDDPEAPVEPDECSCYCHKTGFLRFFLFDIPLVFLRIFGLNQVCRCGKAHY